MARAHALRARADGAGLGVARPQARSGGGLGWKHHPPTHQRGDKVTRERRSQSRQSVTRARALARLMAAAGARRVPRAGGAARVSHLARMERAAFGAYDEVAGEIQHYNCMCLVQRLDGATKPTGATNKRLKRKILVEFQRAERNRPKIRVHFFEIPLLASSSTHMPFPASDTQWSVLRAAVWRALYSVVTRLDTAVTHAPCGISVPSDGDALF